VLTIGERELEDLLDGLDLEPDTRRRKPITQLCPRDWAATRARLDPVQLEQELGRLDIPAALVGAAGCGLSESSSSPAQRAITRRPLEERGSCTGYGVGEHAVGSYQISA
jgi:hypothetical protein